VGGIIAREKAPTNSGSERKGGGLTGREKGEGEKGGRMNE
jgi:hypothetical protein